MALALVPSSTRDSVLGLAYWTGSIAARKGRGPVRWGVFGFFLGLVALLVAYSVPFVQTGVRRLSVPARHHHIPVRAD